MTAVIDRIIDLLVPTGERVHDLWAHGLKAWPRCHAAWILFTTIIIAGTGIWAEHARRTS